ncbi:MAG: hypothetical protein AB7K09_04065 [Planctomycetota bacterium]
MAMVFVIAVGIFAVNMPRVAGGIAVREVMVEKENRLMTTALASLQLGRGMTYYVDLPTFRNFLNLPNHEMVLPTQFQTLNGFEVHLFILNNDADYPNGPGGEFTDTDNTLALHAQVIQRDGGGAIVQQIRMAIDIRIISLTQYNFTSPNFWGTGSLASRAWYGQMLISAEGRALTTVNTGLAAPGPSTQQGYDYWTFSGTQYFYGKLHSTGFNADQANSQIMSGAEHIIYKHKNNTDTTNTLAVLPQIPTALDVTASLAPGGSIYDRAVTVDKTVIPGGSEIFLNPNGQVWYRPFNSAAGAGWIALRNNNGAGSVITQDKATILVNGKATIRGIVTGRLTIAATDSIIINGSIENPQYSKAHLGLVAGNHIFYENRKIYTNSGNKIYAVRPEDPADVSLGGATGGAEIAAKSTGTSTTAFDFIASEVFTSAEWTLIKAGNMSPFNKLVGGTVDAANYTTDVHKTIGQYQEDNFWTGRTSIKGRMPKDGAKVFASLAARWYLSAAIAYPATSDTNRRFETQGGTFTVYGTYSMGIGVDYQATWSNSGGLMTYGTHPAQQATAPDYFVPVVQAYPEFVYGTWKRLD